MEPEIADSPTPLKNVREDVVYSLIYRAQMPGVKPGMANLQPHLYDANPLVVLLSADATGFLGLNVHYLRGVVERGKYILNWRTGKPPSSEQFRAMVHRYLYKRCASGLYEVSNYTVDKDILFSKGVWRGAPGYKP